MHTERIPPPTCLPWGGGTVGHARRGSELAFFMSVRLPSFHAPQGMSTPVPVARDFKKGDQVRVSNGPYARGYKVEAHEAFFVRYQGDDRCIVTKVLGRKTDITEDLCNVKHSQLWDPMTVSGRRAKLSHLPDATRKKILQTAENKVASEAKSREAEMIPGGEGGLVRDEFWGVGGAIADRG